MIQSSDRPLTEELRALGQLIDYPATPPLASQVAARLLQPAPAELAPGSRRPVWRPARRAVLLAIAATIVLAAAAVGVGVGLGGLRLDFTNDPAPSATVSTPEPLGEVVTLEEAESRVGFEVVSPTLAGLGAPDSVHLAGVPESGGVALVYGGRPGYPADPETGVALILTEFRRDIGPETFAKVINRGTLVTPATVNGRRAYWIAGGTHELIYIDASGREIFEVSRLVGDTLIWEQGDLTLRLENAPTVEAAVRIAESVE